MFVRGIHDHKRAVVHRESSRETDVAAQRPRPGAVLRDRQRGRAVRHVYERTCRVRAVKRERAGRSGDGSDAAQAKRLRTCRLEASVTRQHERPILGFVRLNAAVLPNALERCLALGSASQKQCIRHCL